VSTWKVTESRSSFCTTMSTESFCQCFYLESELPRALRIFVHFTVSLQLPRDCANFAPKSDYFEKKIILSVFSTMNLNYRERCEFLSILPYRPNYREHVPILHQNEHKVILTVFLYHELELPRELRVFVHFTVSLQLPRDCANFAPKSDYFENNIILSVFLTLNLNYRERCEFLSILPYRPNYRETVPILHRNPITFSTKSFCQCFLP
jgi:hypothetical protein